MKDTLLHCHRVIVERGQPIWTYELTLSIILHVQHFYEQFYHVSRRTLYCKFTIERNCSLSIVLGTASCPLLSLLRIVIGERQSKDLFQFDEKDEHVVITNPEAH